MPTTTTILMDRCPDEVLLAIFTISCADDGFTGRSLSGVSHRIRRVSALVKYRSLAVRGAAQMNALVAHLASPDDGDFEQNVPKVEHLLLSMNPPEKVEADESASKVAVTSQPKNEGNGASDDKGTGEGTDSSNEDVPKVLEHNRAQEAANALTPLLAVVAPTLRTLFTDFCPKSDALLPSLPRLATLSLPSVESMLRLPSPLPSVSRLHLTSCSQVDSARAHSGRQPFWDMLAASPMHGTLSHLRISGVQFGDVAQFLCVLLDVPVVPEGPRELVDLSSGQVRCISPALLNAHAHFPPGSEDEEHARETASKLSKLKNVWIEGRQYVNRGWCGTNSLLHGAVIFEIQAVARQSQRRDDVGRVVMLPVRDGEYGSEQLLEDWLSYVHGGPGPWTEGPDL
ncbi:hypothetical protein PUNSTDRAFT_146457 [Punctularia strigosozonata HHB-11173 SS5]|uniref:Uncharacterized protein n=1 Tax=Punctularia strigosozonata (strain HHB-11173) TaxID=741275 RepID=R7S3Q6_PUNST|nr:uncharacterized protein PUNSTDRAFT_146457 [Punctularia strigosozonata HHB-11173 SS5]EIN04494.1 hypothetical protein PUNSTDRAFT_146457 [Punctularia strigosozonata HHB-11173 SS5]